MNPTPVRCGRTSSPGSPLPCPRPSAPPCMPRAQPGGSPLRPLSWVLTPRDASCTLAAYSSSLLYLFPLSRPSSHRGS